MSETEHTIDPTLTELFKTVRESLIYLKFLHSEFEELFYFSQNRLNIMYEAGPDFFDWTVHNALLFDVVRRLSLLSENQCTRQERRVTTLRTLFHEHFEKTLDLTDEKDNSLKNELLNKWSEFDTGFENLKKYRDKFLSHTDEAIAKKDKVLIGGTFGELRDCIKNLESIFKRMASKLTPETSYDLRLHGIHRATTALIRLELGNRLFKACIDNKISREQQIEIFGITNPSHKNSYFPLINEVTEYVNEKPPTIIRYPDAAFSLDALKQLFREYNEALGISLAFQNFETELAELPGKYAPEQRGQLYLVQHNNAFVGCCGFYAFSETQCELKRLFVKPEAQGWGLGKLLLQTAIEEATNLGYTTLLLDSLHRLTAARKLYERLGFKEVPPYNQNPHEDVYYMALAL